MQEPPEQPDKLRSMTGGGFHFGELATDSPAYSLDAVRSLIDARGGARAVAQALDMDPRNMQRIYAGKRHCSPTLARRIAEIAEAPDGQA